MTGYPGVALTDLLVRSTKCRPESPALTGRRCRWSYAGLARAITACALRIAQERPHHARVALLFRNSAQYVAAYYGVLAAGAAAVPLNPQESSAVLRRQIEHSEATLLLGDDRHSEWPALSGDLCASDVAVLGISARDEADNLERFIAQMAVPVGVKPAEFAPRGGNALATILYTSGTTGRPKGVQLSQGNLGSNAAAIVEYLQLTPQDRGIAVLPMQFAYGASVLHSHLAAGAELLLEESFSYPHDVLKRMKEGGVTGFSGVPSTYALLLARCNLRDAGLGSLRYLTQAGGPMPASAIRQVCELLPAAKFYVMYGQTEATARLTYLPPDRLADKAGSVGTAIPGVQVRVHRADGTEAGVAETGEIVARGRNVMLGYLKDEEASRQALRDGWLHTGDLGHLDGDGFLYIDGRASEMIKVGSYRVSPAEVEEVIAAIPGVVDVGVTAIPDDLLGEAVKAVIVARAGIRLDVPGVKAACRKHLAAYKVPKQVEFVAALPRTATGKVQRSLLA